MRPGIRFLTDELIERIVDEARGVLCQIGVDIHNEGARSMLSDHGAMIDSNGGRVRYADEIIDRALRTVPKSFRLYDLLGEQTHDLAGSNVHFTPGSAAINVLDASSNSIRPPTAVDYVRYAKLVSRLDNLASQSTSLIPQDVHAKISDSFRLYLSLLYCEKPVITGAFTIDAFSVMRDLLLAVRGTQEELAAKPLAVLTCCPTAPLKWCDVTSQNLIDCATHSIPVEIISAPLAGLVSPVTLVGTLVQLTAETLSGVVIAQLTNPGTPLLWGGSPSVFDVRYETTPIAAIESMMIACSSSEIGKHLGFPTQAYISLSDSKQLDAQAGLETSMGATLGALAGINNISGPGMLDFESCISLEKLVVDNEICGMALRMVKGVVPKDDFPAAPRFEELLAEHHLLTSNHTRKHLTSEHLFPGPVIDRANRPRWLSEGGSSLGERACREVEVLLANYEPTRVSRSTRTDLTDRMEAEARRFGMDALPKGE